MSFGGRTTRARLLLLLVLVIVPRAAWPQGPLGPEFRVNTHTTSFQWFPAVTSDSTGNFVVVWHSYFQDGSGAGVFGQRYAATGAPLGAEFRVNTYTADAQFSSDVASDASGNFVVAWRSGTYVRGDVVAQRYASTGAPLGSEFRVNSYTTAAQGAHAVASDPAGNFVVLWTSQYQDGSGLGVFGQRFANSGAPLGAEFRVNTYTTDNQLTPSAAYDPAGNVIVVWRSNEQDGSNYGVFGQRYDSSGAPLGSEFRVNTFTTNAQNWPAVTADAAGNFVVVWQSLTQDGYGIFGQRYAGTGAPMGPEFRVNTTTTIGGFLPSVVADPSGNFVVAWVTYQQYGSSSDVFGQRYDSSGAPVGSEFRVNTFTTSAQNRPAVTADAAGNFVVVWQSLQDGDAYGVFGQRYRQITPAELMRFGIE